MAVDREIQGILDFIASRGVPPHYELPVEEARINMLKGRAVVCPPEPVALPRIEALSAPGPAGPIPLRLYAASRGRALPVLVYYHGGGWVIGNLDSHDDLCRRLAQESGCLVISVDYRLAPEHRFPAAVEDARAALEWVAAQAATLGGDPARIAVGGDSAGANLATVVARQARQTGGPALAFQLLVYPVTDCDFSRSSYAQHARGYILTRQGMDWFWDHYLPDSGARTNALASPLRADSLAGLPPALVQLAEYDVLLDEGLAYAHALEAAGVPVTVRHYPGAIHGFFSMTVTQMARTAIADAGAALKAALGA